MAVMNLIHRLQVLADGYCAATEVPRSSVSRAALGDPRRLDQVFAGDAGLTVARFERAMHWFSANWPEGLAWPDGVERPALAEGVPS